ncbi:hypothetical protein BG845_01811 [Pseudonocardia autotrophica]|uniref:Uncharacterized protein n=2 Tax=Pseudonocardia TaxID=1847 RepID=A0A1Y2N2R7_PSEAH|nr:hypothetical protein BG845_01811 [Pseudonocardia autotrophica]
MTGTGRPARAAQVVTNVPPREWSSDAAVAYEATQELLGAHHRAERPARALALIRRGPGGPVAAPVAVLRAGGIGVDEMRQLGGDLPAERVVARRERVARVLAVRVGPDRTAAVRLRLPLVARVHVLRPR